MSYNKWTKKLDEIHYTKDGKTLCGRPCLGNNYSEVFPNREFCAECEKISKENKKVVSWVLNVICADGTEEKISEVHPDVAVMVDEWLAEEGR